MDNFNPVFYFFCILFCYFQNLIIYISSVSSIKFIWQWFINIIIYPLVYVYLSIFIKSSFYGITIQQYFTFKNYLCGFMKMPFHFYFVFIENFVSADRYRVISFF